MTRLAHVLGMTAAECRFKCFLVPLLCVLAVVLLASAGAP